MVREEVQKYRLIMVSRVVDGVRTSFGHDHWLFGTTLAYTFAALYSHSLRPAEHFRF
jgi:hypothetical protein